MKYLRNKIIRPKYSKSTAIHIKDIDHAYFNEYRLTVRYFDTSGDNGFSKKDTLVISQNYLMSHFEALLNPGKINNFEQGEWVPLEKIKEYADRRWG